MTTQRKMALGFLMEPAATHAAGWMQFAGQSDVANDISHFTKMAREAEAAKLDFQRRGLFRHEYEGSTLREHLA